MSEMTSLNTLAAECHRLEVKQGTYDPGEHGPWAPRDGYMQIRNEAREWETEAGLVDVTKLDRFRNAEIAEYGNLLATVLSIGHHRGIDVEGALAVAIERNQERAGEVDRQ